MAIRSSEKNVKKFQTAKSEACSSAKTSDALRSLVAQKAYQLYEKRGRTNGNDLSDWFEAEKSVMRECGKSFTPSSRR